MSFQREPGFYLGAIYVNYGITSAALLVAYAALTFGVGATAGRTLAICTAVAVLLPILLFRHARSLWLAMDVFIDRDGH